MTRMCSCLAFLLCLSVPIPGIAQSDDPNAEPRMTRERMEKILRSLSTDVRGRPGSLEFEVNGVRMQCISDLEYDRMRIVAAISRVSSLTGEQVASILEANFHSALDARYATSQGVLYAAFIHPLGSLTERELRSAVRQVLNLSRSFGSSYSSGELIFGGGLAL